MWIASMLIASLALPDATMSIVQQGVIPPPPEARIEILAPTPRSHVLNLRCGGYRDVLAWVYDGQSARFTAARLLGKSLSISDRATLDHTAASFGDDLMIRVECNYAGATLTLFAANSVGSERERRTDFDYDQHGLRQY